MATQIILSSNLHGCLDTWGDYTTLLMLYRRLLQDNLQKDNVLLSKEMKVFVFGELGIAYQQLGYVSKSVKYHQQATEIAKEIGNRRAEGSNLGYLGNAYRNLGELRKSIEYHEDALKIAKEIGNMRGEVRWLGNLGNSYCILGEPERAIECCEHALKITREIGYKRGEGDNFENLGLAYSYLGELEKAIEFLNNSLAIGKEIEDPRIINFCENKLKELDEIEDSENSDYYPTSNNPPASKNLFQNIVSKLKSKK